MRSTYGLTGDLIYQELSCKIDNQMNMQTQKGAQKILQKKRRQEKIINGIIQFDDDSASDDDNDLVTKLDVVNSLEVQEAEADGVLFVTVVVAVVVVIRDRKYDGALCFFYFKE
ncbi:hypothetical protein BCV72DRAFT_239693 [Rhizopus microsporus var. microsporus]|uniref:Uncharacterized protein n=2 Tax=Rhizopus microsporus TaxID=58291 RepID=A0A2G4T207_RHIZD|nr:uncharacterized protein RHIMIDRAFT_249412 [Rhizopus microsporus ATCC 52813]ORE09444.1 hypothetical protein BCV72DRAFT_239693 [Rhizopus microsporus var. microsporus]PHZ15060.1 hypothetical protein RHIMIDRAFT_249412 [Rhizopus microsporus ATCC 52813]